MNALNVDMSTPTGSAETTTEVGNHPLLHEEVMTTPNERTNAWRVLVVCIMKTTTSHDSGNLTRLLLEKYPSPVKLAIADQTKVQELVKSLGIGSKRAEWLVEMSKQFMAFRNNGLDIIDVTDLHGCGAYAEEAWRMFVLKDQTFVPHDKDLRRRMRELNGEVFDWDRAVVIEGIVATAEKVAKKLAKADQDEKIARVHARASRRDSLMKEKKNRKDEKSAVLLLALSKKSEAASAMIHDQRKRSHRHTKTQERKI